jgi:protein TonB
VTAGIPQQEERTLVEPGHPQISALDRLSFAVFMAVAVHALIILYDFVHEDPAPAPFTMEITLAQFDDEEAPKEADFLGQSHQLGSGTMEEKLRMTTSSRSAQQNVLVQESAALPEIRPEPTDPAKNLITAHTERSERPLTEFAPQELIQDDETPRPRKSLMERSVEIAQLEADLDRQMQLYARRPRIERLTGASIMKAVDSQYVQHVTGKIERIGNRNFPRHNSRPLYGSPRVSIKIYSDGSIMDIEILESSGNLVLDEATIQIIRMAAPFSPFPKEVRKERDVLELIRTFDYASSGVSSH